MDYQLCEQHVVDDREEEDKGPTDKQRRPFSFFEKAEK